VMLFPTTSPPPPPTKSCSPFFHYFPFRVVFLLFLLFLRSDFKGFSPSCHFPLCTGIYLFVRLRWAGHVARMGERRGAYGALVGKPEGS
jgi:hypothetical protein